MLFRLEQFKREKWHLTSFWSNIAHLSEIQHASQPENKLTTSYCKKSATFFLQMQNYHFQNKQCSVEDIMSLGEDEKTVWLLFKPKGKLTDRPNVCRLSLGIKATKS